MSQPVGIADVEGRAFAEGGTLLRAVVGSTAHGLALEGADDRDELGICIEAAGRVIGLRSWEQWVYRTQPEGVRSGPGDLDLTVYSLRKYVKLALKGNPTILLLLFVKPEDCLIITEQGLELQDLAPAIVSRRAGKAFLGYLTAQKERLTGERGQRGVKRPELEAKYGYDTKFAMHMLRLGYQGVQLLETGRLELPMPEKAREHVMAVRHGEADLGFVLLEAVLLQTQLEQLLTTSSLREEPDYERVERWLVRTYLDVWVNGLTPCEP
jgi:hypothetical protein